MLLVVVGILGFLLSVVPSVMAASVLATPRLLPIVRCYISIGLTVITLGNYKYRAIELCSVEGEVAEHSLFD